MIEKITFPLLLIILLMYVLDRKKMKQAAAANRWFAYTIYAVSFAIWLYRALGTTAVTPSVWLVKMMDALLPLP